MAELRDGLLEAGAAGWRNLGLRVVVGVGGGIGLWLSCCSD